MKYLVPIFVSVGTMLLLFSPDLIKWFIRRKKTKTLAREEAPIEPPREIPVEGSVEGHPGFHRIIVYADSMAAVAEQSSGNHVCAIAVNRWTREEESARILDYIAGSTPMPPMQIESPEVASPELPVSSIHITADRFEMQDSEGNVRVRIGDSSSFDNTTSTVVTTGGGLMVGMGHMSAYGGAFSRAYDVDSGNITTVHAVSRSVVYVEHRTAWSLDIEQESIQSHLAARTLLVAPSQGGATAMADFSNSLLYAAAVMKGIHKVSAAPVKLSRVGKMKLAKGLKNPTE